MFDHIVSLGGDCFPRVSLSKVGIKKLRAQGERSYPFDLAVTPLKSVIEMIWNDFSGYHEYKLVEKEGELLIELVKYPGTFLNHESPMSNNFFESGPLQYVKNNFEELRKRYSNRIDNFREILNSDNKVLFVVHLTECTSENDVIRLIKTIEGCHPLLVFQVLVIRLYHPVQTNIKSTEKIIFYEDLIEFTWNSSEKFTHALAEKLKTFLLSHVFDNSQSFPI